MREEFGDHDQQYAYRALRAVLHTLRDRLPVDVAAKLAAQLPTLIRGIYYVTPGEIDEILAVLPDAFRGLINA